jgi:pimeloyl-ACP methyl ester carboxylesterase
MARPPVIEGGMKPALILLPGMPCDGRLWAHQTEHLSDLCDPIVADVTAADSMQALAAAVIAQAPPGSFALAGLSMGGYCALEILRQAPERVTRLALLDTSAAPDTDEAKANRLKAIAQAEHDYAGVLDTLLPKLLHRKDAALMEVARAMAMSVGREGYIRQQRAIMSRADSRPHLAAIQCPTLVLCGREDGVTPVAVHESMAAAIPGAMLEIIEGAGHFTPLEQPEAVTAAMRRWLAA